MDKNELAKVREALEEIAKLGNNPEGFQNPLCCHASALWECGRRATDALTLLGCIVDVSGNGYHLQTFSVADLPDVKAEGGANTLSEVMDFIDQACNLKSGLSLDWVEVGILQRALKREPLADARCDTCNTKCPLAHNGGNGHCAGYVPCDTCTEKQVHPVTGEVGCVLGCPPAVADGAWELAQKVEVDYLQSDAYNFDRDGVAALITQALREEREKAAERAEDKLRSTWFDYKGVKIMVPLEIVKSLRTAIMGEKE